MTGNSVFDEQIGATLFNERLAERDIVVLQGFATERLSEKPGYRVRDRSLAWLLGSHGLLGQLASSVLGEGAVPIKCVLFNKTHSINWSTPWHQDRVVPMREKKVLDGYENWSAKDGLDHVEPPFCIIEQMVTFKVLLDDCGLEQGPIRVAAGSHRFGKLSSAQLPGLVSSLEEVPMVGQAGDVWAHAGSIIHASAKSDCNDDRRILHVDYSAFDLPAVLNWQSLV